MRFALSSILLLLTIVLGSFNFQPAKKSFVPPGTVKINDTLYFDKTEITNLNWREYESWCKQIYGDSSAEYKKALPDTLTWRDKLSYCEPYVAHYYRHPAYSDYPVVGISYEQVAEYCKWRTARVKKKMELDAHSKKILPQVIKYRLPSKDEWEEVAKAGYDDEKSQKKILKQWEGSHLYNAVYGNYDSTKTYPRKINPNAEITAPAESYIPNKRGIYNLFGNVAEMISEKGIAKGGGWADKISTLKAENDFPYKKPTAWLGFRCVCVVKWN